MQILRKWAFQRTFIVLNFCVNNILLKREHCPNFRLCSLQLLSPLRGTFILTSKAVGFIFLFFGIVYKLFTVCFLLHDCFCSTLCSGWYVVVCRGSFVLILLCMCTVHVFYWRDVSRSLLQICSFVHGAYVFRHLFITCDPCRWVWYVPFQPALTSTCPAACL